MRKIYLEVTLVFASLFLFSYHSFAQSGSVYTVAGGGSATTDGVPGPSVYLDKPTGMGLDAMGNLYFAEKNQHVIRKIDAATGLISTVAGITGGAGYTGDGGPATSAYLMGYIRDVFVTPGGDIYIAGDDRIRKVSGATGIITRIAGGGSSTADGIPATNASMSVRCVYVDSVGNVYTGTDNKIKKIDGVTGIITTIAGTGATGDGGDGGPAISATIGWDAESICMDNAGNIYFISGLGNRVRKIDAATGIINTVVGGGTSTAEWVPATNASFYGYSCGVDGAGNIFVGDSGRGLIRRINQATGLINTIAGVPSGGSLTDGVNALSVSMIPSSILVSPATGRIYYSEFLPSKVRKFTYSPLVGLAGPAGYYSDSFYINIEKRCSGPTVTIRTMSFHSSMEIATDYGDGTSDISSVASSWSGVGGYIIAGHSYLLPGTYTVKHTLLNAGVAVDSFTYNYNHIFCSEMSVKFFNDADFNCVKSGVEKYIGKTIITEIDSNGVPVDTMIATSGFDYMAYGTPGDVFTFKLLSIPSALYVSCPTSGILFDTLQYGVTTNPTRWMGFSCYPSATSDLSVHAIAPIVGINDQTGSIFISNNQCIPTNASVTLNFSPKLRFEAMYSYPPPVSSTATSITWSLSDISLIDAYPAKIYYMLWHNPAFSYPVDGDTALAFVSVSATSGAGDINLANNMVIRIDTFRTSCDPNAIEVSPTCFDNDTTFHFTVHFENVGSAPAENIYVMDSISSYFDPSTLNIEMSTHPMFTSKYYADGKTIFKFNFPDINLADSSDHENRDGMFMYTIKNKPGMARGDAALSRVGIYFDYNDVLMTNTVENRKGCPVPSRVATTSNNLGIFIFPNPTTGDLTIKTEPNTFTSFTITNTVGQQVWQQSMVQSQERVNVAQLPAGVYYVTLKGEGVSEVRKFVKW